MKATILLISYHTSVRDSISPALLAEDYEITVASDGREALRSVRETGFDLVLLDLDMPAPNAWDTLRPIITNSLSLPLIIITGQADKQRLATQKGVVAVLEKPLDLPLLRDAVERALAGSLGGFGPESP